jgi:hypothetical protein
MPQHLVVHINDSLFTSCVIVGVVGVVVVVQARGNNK